MSRIGKLPIAVPNGVTITLDGNTVKVKGPKGELTHRLPGGITVEKNENTLNVKRESEETNHKSLHGLTRSLIANMVEGVTKGYEKRLSIIGVGYRAALKGKDLEVQVGYSHPVVVPQPDGIEFEVPAPTSIIVRGSDKQLVGEVAANIRKIRKPEPYKGKGIRYEDEYVRKKAGKAAKGAA